jgi:hypothetical protein
MPADTWPKGGVPENAHRLSDNLFQRIGFDCDCAHGAAGDSNRRPKCANAVNTTTRLRFARYANASGRPEAAAEHANSSITLIRILGRERGVFRSCGGDHRRIVRIRAVTVSQLNVASGGGVPNIINVQPTGVSLTNSNQ